jgi:hypothetical protein
MTIDVKKRRTIAEAAKNVRYPLPALRWKIEHRELNAVRIGDIYQPRSST